MSNQKTSEVRQLTGLRGIAALIVVFSHYNLHNNHVLGFMLWHNLAVDVFFALSVFTLCLVYRAETGQPLHHKAYAVARFARVVPVYLLAFGFSALLVPMEVSEYPHAMFLSDGLRQLLMINAWPVVGSGTFWNAPGWSLSIEVFCYIFVFPLLFIQGRKCMALPIWARVAIMLGCGLINALVYIHFYNPSVQAFKPELRGPSMAHWVGVIRGAAMFVAGWVGYLSFRRQDALAWFCRDRADIIGIAVLAIGFSRAIDWENDHYIALMIPFFLIGLMNDKAWFSRILSGRVPEWLGRISYSLYILHWPIKSLLIQKWHGYKDYPTWQCIPLGVGISLMAAIISYYCLERPARMGLRRLFNLKTNPPVQ